MKKRQWAILGGIAVLGVAILLFFLLSSGSDEKQPARKAPVKSVDVIRVENNTVPVVVRLDGKLNALQKIEIFAEVNGILQPGGKKFEEGISYRKGEVLLRLENSEARANYLSAKSQFTNSITQVLPDIKIDYPGHFESWRNYLSKISDADYVPEPPRPDDEQLRLFLVGRQVYSSYQNLSSARIRLEKYTVRAPFPGTVTEALVDPGVLVRAGQRLGEFLQQGEYELETSVGSSELHLVEEGDSVLLSSPDSKGQWKGELFRINPKINPNTQQVKVFVRISSDDLKDGMFMNGEISARPVENAFRLPRKLIYEGDYTYIVQDSVLERRQLEIIQRNPETVIARGLEDGTKVPSQPIAGAFEGLRVRVISDDKTSKGASNKNSNN